MLDKQIFNHAMLKEAAPNQPISLVRPPSSFNNTTNHPIPQFNKFQIQNLSLFKFNNLSLYKELIIVCINQTFVFVQRSSTARALPGSPPALACARLCTEAAAQRRLASLASLASPRQTCCRRSTALGSTWRQVARWRGGHEPKGSAW